MYTMSMTTTTYELHTDMSGEPVATGMSLLDIALVWKVARPLALIKVSVKYDPHYASQDTKHVIPEHIAMAMLRNELRQN